MKNRNFIFRNNSTNIFETFRERNTEREIFSSTTRFKQILNDEKRKIKLSGLNANEN